MVLGFFAFTTEKSNTTVVAVSKIVNRYTYYIYLFVWEYNKKIKVLENRFRFFVKKMYH